MDTSDHAWDAITEALIDPTQIADFSAFLARAAVIAGEVPDRRALIQIERAMLHLLRDEMPEADAALAVIAPKDLSTHMAIRLTLTRAELAANRDLSAALQIAGQADTLAKSLVEPHPRLYTLGALIDLCRRAGLTEPLPDLADFLVQQATFTQDPLLIAAALTNKADIELLCGRPQLALKTGRAAHAKALLLEPHPSRDLVEARAAAVRGIAARISGHPLEAIESLEEATEWPLAPFSWHVEHLMAATAAGMDFLALCERIGQRVRSADDRRIFAPILAMLLVGEGRYLEAESLARSWMSGAETLMLQARIALSGDDLPMARVALERLRPLVIDSDAAAHLSVLDATLTRAEGDDVGALDILDAAVQQAQDAKGAHAERHARLRRAELLAGIGDTDNALTDTRSVIDTGTLDGDPDTVVAAHIVRARCLLMLDRPDAAETEIEDALNYAEQAGADGLINDADLVRLVLAATLNIDHRGQDALVELVSRRSDGTGPMRRAMSLALARLAGAPNDVRLSQIVDSPSKQRAHLLTIMKSTFPSVK